MFSNNNFQFLNTCIKRAQKFLKLLLQLLSLFITYNLYIIKIVLIGGIYEIDIALTYYINKL